MEEMNVTKISLSTFFLILAIIVIIVMGIFIYKLNNDKTTELQKSTELQSQVNSLNSNVSELQEKISKVSKTVNTDKTQENNSSDNSVQSTTTNSSLFIIKEINISDQQSLYNFNTKKWVKEIAGAESMHFIAIDNDKNLYIVDRFENIVKKLDAQLKKLNIDDTNVDNYVTFANVSKKDNTLVISTGDDFITYIVSLDDYSTKLAEINDD